MWHNKDGRLTIWYDNPSDAGVLRLDHGPVPTEWSVAATGDVNADGQGEILWRRSDGAISTWSSTGRAVGYQPDAGLAENTYYHDSVGASWLVEGLADFTGDNRSDILWRNTDGSLSTWSAAQADTIAFQENSWFHAPLSLAWHVAGLGDFNGDGKDDILWHNDNGAVSVWTSTGSGFTEGQFNAGAATNWHVAQVGDFNNDGIADILWQNTDGAASIWQSTGSGWTQNVYYDAGLGSSWSVVAHDFLL